MFYDMTSSDEKFNLHASSFTNYAFGSVFVYFFTKTIKSFFMIGHNYSTEKMLIRKFGPGFMYHPSLAVSTLIDGYIGVIDNFNETNALTNLAILAFQNFFCTRQVFLLGQGSLNIYSVIIFGLLGLIISMAYVCIQFATIFSSKGEINHSKMTWTMIQSYLIYLIILFIGILITFDKTFPDVVIIYDPFNKNNNMNHFRLDFFPMIWIIILGVLFLSFIFLINVLFFMEGGPVYKSMTNAMDYSHASVIIRGNIFIYIYFS